MSPSVAHQDGRKSSATTIGSAVGVYGCSMEDEGPGAGLLLHEHRPRTVAAVRTPAATCFALSAAISNSTSGSIPWTGHEGSLWRVRGRICATDDARAKAR